MDYWFLVPRLWRKFFYLRFCKIFY